MQHGVFSAFFIVQHKLQRNARAAWPLRMRRAAAVADQVAGVAVGLTGVGQGEGHDLAESAESAESATIEITLAAPVWAARRNGLVRATGMACVKNVMLKLYTALASDGFKNHQGQRHPQGVLWA